MTNMRQHYEDRFAQDDPYQCGRPENKFWLMLALAKIDLVTRLAKRWTVRHSVDVGCGDWGIFHEVRSTLGTDLAVAGDLSLLAVQKAKKNSAVADRTRFVVFNAERLPFRSDAFDLVYCSEVIEHTVDAQQTIRELARLATHRVVMSVPNEKLIGKLDPEHLQTFGHDDFCDLIERAGLRIKSCLGVFFFVRRLPLNKLPFLPFGMMLIRTLLKLGEWIPKRGLQILVVAEKHT